LPPDELAKLEAEEKYGPINPEIRCIFCKTTGPVRYKQEEHYVGGGPAKNSPEGLGYLATIGIERHTAAIRAQCETRAFAHCMKCGNDWEMFPPAEDKANSAQS